MDRRGWIGSSLAAAGGSLLGLLGLPKASVASPAPAGPRAALRLPSPSGQQVCDRVTISYTQDVHQYPDGTFVGGTTKLIFSYAGITDEAGVKGWYTRLFSLTHHWVVDDAIRHLGRMLQPGNFDLTVEERAMLWTWFSGLGELYIEMTSGIHKDVAG